MCVSYIIVYPDYLLKRNITLNIQNIREELGGPIIYCYLGA